MISISQIHFTKEPNEVSLLSPIPQQLCFWQTVSIPPSPQNQKSSGNSGESALPRNDKGLHAWKSEADKHLPPLSFSLGSLPQPCCLGPEERKGRTEAKQGLALAWGKSGTAGDRVGALTG